MDEWQSEYILEGNDSSSSLPSASTQYFDGAVIDEEDSRINNECVDPEIAVNKPTFKNSLQAKKRLQAFSKLNKLKDFYVKDAKSEENSVEKTDFKTAQKSRRDLYPDEYFKATIQEIELIKQNELGIPKGYNQGIITNAPAMDQDLLNNMSYKTDELGFKRRDIKGRNFRRTESFTRFSSPPPEPVEVFAISKPNQQHPQSDTKDPSIKQLSSRSTRREYPRNWSEYVEMDLTLERDLYLKEKLFKKIDNKFEDYFNFVTPAPIMEPFRCHTDGPHILIPFTYLRCTKSNPQMLYSVNIERNEAGFISRNQLFNIVPEERRVLIQKLMINSKCQPESKRSTSIKWYPKRWPNTQNSEAKLIENSVGLSFLQTYSDEEEDEQEENTTTLKSEDQQPACDHNEPTIIPKPIEETPEIHNEEPTTENGDDRIEDELPEEQYENVTASEGEITDDADSIHESTKSKKDKTKDTSKKDKHKKDEETAEVEVEKDKSKKPKKTNKKRSKTRHQEIDDDNHSSDDEVEDIVKKIKISRKKKNKSKQVKKEKLKLSKKKAKVSKSNIDLEFEEEKDRKKAKKRKKKKQRHDSNESKELCDQIEKTVKKLKKSKKTREDKLENIEVSKKIEPKPPREIIKVDLLKMNQEYLDRTRSQSESTVVQEEERQNKIKPSKPVEESSDTKSRNLSDDKIVSKDAEIEAPSKNSKRRDSYEELTQHEYNKSSSGTSRSGKKSKSKRRRRSTQSQESREVIKFKTPTHDKVLVRTCSPGWESEEEPVVKKTYEPPPDAISCDRGQPLPQAGDSDNFDLEIPLNIKPFTRREIKVEPVVFDADLELEVLRQQSRSLYDERLKLEIEKMRVKELELEMMRQKERSKRDSSSSKSKRRRSSRDDHFDIQCEWELEHEDPVKKKKKGRWDSKGTKPLSPIIDISQIKTEKDEKKLENEYEEFLKAVNTSNTDVEPSIEVLSSDSNRSDSSVQFVASTSPKRVAKIVESSSFVNSTLDNIKDIPLPQQVIKNLDELLPSPMITESKPDIKPVPAPSTKVESIIDIKNPLINLNLSASISQNITLNLTTSVASVSSPISANIDIKTPKTEVTKTVDITQLPIPTHTVFQAQNLTVSETKLIEDIVLPENVIFKEFDKVDITQLPIPTHTVFQAQNLTVPETKLVEDIVLPENIVFKGFDKGDILQLPIPTHTVFKPPNFTVPETKLVEDIVLPENVVFKEFDKVDIRHLPIPTQNLTVPETKLDENIVLPDNVVFKEFNRVTEDIAINEDTFDIELPDESFEKPVRFTSMVLPSKKLLLDNSGLNLNDSDNEEYNEQRLNRSFELYEAEEEQREEERKLDLELPCKDSEIDKKFVEEEVKVVPPIIVKPSPEILKKSEDRQSNESRKSSNQISVRKVESKQLPSSGNSRRESSSNKSQRESPRRNDSLSRGRRSPIPRSPIKKRMRSISPRRRSPVRKRSPGRRSPSPRRRRSPIGRAGSPAHKRRSPPRRPPSPKPKRSFSPRRRGRSSISPRKRRSPSPRGIIHRRSPSPKRHDRIKKPPSPKRSSEKIIRSKSPVYRDLKRSVADSTISDDLLPQNTSNEHEYADSPMSRYFDSRFNVKNMGYDSPKRPPLDVRINQALGLGNENVPKTNTPTQITQIMSYITPDYAVHGYEEDKMHEEMHHIYRVPTVVTNTRPCEPPKVVPSPQFKQVGNMLQILPNDDIRSSVPPVVENPIQKIVQVGNMLQIVPQDIPPELIPIPPPPPPAPEPKPPQAKLVSPMIASPPPKNQSAEASMKQKVAERRAEREKRRQDRDKRRKEKEKQRREKEKRRQIKLKIKTENMIKKALELEVSEGLEIDEENLDETPTQWPPLPIGMSHTPDTSIGKSILVNRILDFSRSDADVFERRQNKVVKFADGVRPGEGTSTSGGEELSSPPPPRHKLPKEKRYKKTKIPKKSKKKKVKVKIIKRHHPDSDDSDDDDNLPPPSPPPGSPPPHIFPPRIKTHTLNNLSPSYLANILQTAAQSTILHNTNYQQPVFGQSVLNLTMAPPPPPPHHHGPPPPPHHGPPRQLNFQPPPPHHHPPPPPPHHHGPPPPPHHHGPPPPPPHHGPGHRPF